MSTRRATGALCAVLCFAAAALVTFGILEDHPGNRATDDGGSSGSWLLRSPAHVYSGGHVVRVRTRSRRQRLPT